MLLALFVLAVFLGIGFTAFVCSDHPKGGPLEAVGVMLFLSFFMTIVLFACTYFQWPR